jgi:hypothetical protein
MRATSTRATPGHKSAWNFFGLIFRGEELMSNKPAKFFWPGLLVILAASGLSGLLAARARSANLAQRPATPAANRRTPRNLSLQPEAFKLGRRLGQRFMSSGRAVSTLNGVLITSSKREPIHIQRLQNDRGEKVRITIGNDPPSLSWSEEEGAKSSHATISEEERLLIERLSFDSADQFVLAQLRGASYYTVARNVRPIDAGDNYDGPLWNVVRVHESGNWRFYYINTRTGLIDKIAYELRGEQVEANFAAWTEQDGETVPSQITWTRSGQVIMEFNLLSFSRSQTEQD